MISHVFVRYKYDSCVYIKFVDGSPICLLLSVDDMLIAAKGMKEITTLKAHLSSEFEMKDLDAANKILGMKITWVWDIKYGLLFLSQQSYIKKVLHRFNMDGANSVKDLDAANKILGMKITWVWDIKYGLLFLSQQSYIKKVLHRFNMDGANSVSTPIAPHFKLSVSQCPTTDEEFEYMIYLTKDQMFHERTKHIDVKYHFVRDIVAQGKWKVCKISTHDNPADMMTKPVPVAKFELCSNLVGLTD